LRTSLSEVIVQHIVLFLDGMHGKEEDCFQKAGESSSFLL